ncbi:MAG TPA: oligosaccharide flippase family protein [Chitinophagales bacterium]|nr:oligosaccharide flippase family protein [Chitinophagales bacterium]
MFKFSSLSSLQLFQLIRYGTFILIGICYAKLSLPQSEIGHFETFLLVSGMVSFFWVSGLINSMLSIYPKKGEEEKKAVLFNTFVTLFLFSLLAGVLLLVFSSNLLGFLDKQSDGKLIKLAILYLLLSNPSFVAEYILYLNDRKTEIVLYGASVAFLSLCVAVVPVYYNYPVEYAMYGLIVVALLRLLFTVFLLGRFASFKFDSGIQLNGIRVSLPLIGSLFVSGSAEYIDGILVKAKFDDMFFAVYRYGAKELPILLIVANTFSTAMVPVISGNLQQGLEELKARSTRLMHIFFPLTMVLMILSPVIYKYAFSDSFIYSSIIFNIYLLLAIPRFLFPQTVLTGLQHNRYLLISSLLEITINVSLSVYLAGKIGLPGIAMGTFVAYTFDKVFLMAVLRFRYGIKTSSYVTGFVFFSYTFASLAAFALAHYLFKNGFWGF